MLIYELDPDADQPVSAQLATQIVAAITAGNLAVGTKLPSVRQLAADLGLAPNTVAKVYRQLEADGHVATHGRNGTIVLDPGERELRRGRVDEAARALVVSSRGAGLDLDAALAALRREWRR